jgi:NitT/TauT family transport system permease protein
MLMVQAVDTFGPDSLEAAQAAFRTARQRELWRRRTLPLVGALALLGIWGLLVYVFEVPPFVAPSPQLVAQTLVAIQHPDEQSGADGDRGGLRLPLGNLSAIVIATIFVHKKASRGLLPDGGADQHHPRRRQGADPCC